MLTKEGLKAKFSRDWKNQYQVEIFKEKGFVRKQCKACGKFFWTLDNGRQTCGDSSCEPYGFIGKPITKGRWDYIETWKLFEKFFVSRGHTSIPRYPVIDRVRPDLYFTIASIQDFQRIDNGNMNFVYPANPLIVPQVCLRFIDIPSVGLSGRHLTSFVMPGQHAFNYPKEGYFKDRCIELNFEFLTKHMGIPEKELVYAEDIWTMPDFSAFGPCIETFSKGLELVNHVFMQFQKTESGYKELPMKVNDTGWGLSRLVWFSNGTHTVYDCIFGNVIEKMKKESGIRIDPDIFSKYSKLSSSIDTEERRDIAKLREIIARKIGVSVKELSENIEPMQAIYAIADHIRTLLFAISDGGIPSNVGGGYNLRVILRRVFSFMDRYSLTFDLTGLAEGHAKFLKPMFPELTEGLENFSKIVEIEREKHKSTVENAKKIITGIVSRKEKLDEKKLIELYESHGITPEIIRDIAKTDVSENIYSRITERHESKAVKEDKKIDVSGLPATDMLFYREKLSKEFEAKVLRIAGNHVILDRTLFYPTSGGQACDYGFINGNKVYDVEKVGNVIVHFLEKIDFRPGGKVKGVIDWDRRYQLMQHHTAIHIINGASRKVLGRHIWQAGTEKTPEKAHLDITHFMSLTEEELDKIEEEANKIIKKNSKVIDTWLPRSEAEKRYGYSLYQGGVVPGNEVRVIEIPGWDIEACGGTHMLSTKDIGQIIIISSERIQDGINRITIKAGRAAKDYLEKVHSESRRIAEDMKSINIEFSDKFLSGLTQREALRELRRLSQVFSVPVEQAEKTIEKFSNQIKSNLRELNKVQKAGLQKKKFSGFREAGEYIFSLWKEQEKQIEKLTKNLSESNAETLMRKRAKDTVFEIVNYDRKRMIETANSMLNKDSSITVILANQVGDVVCMSRTKDANKIISELMSRTGGKGGGSKQLAQGRADVSKLIRVREEFLKK